MFIFWPIIIGLIVGAIVAISVHSQKSLSRNLLVSIFGALFIRLVTHLIILTHRGESDSNFIITLVSCALGSILFTLIYNVLPEEINDEE